MLSRRIFAFIIDMVIHILLISFIIYIVMYYSRWKMTDNLINTLSIILSFIYILLYALHIYIFKRTLGQRLYKIEFYKKNDEKLFFIQNIVLRIFLITWFGVPLLMLSIIWIIINKNEDPIIDDITKMYVRKYIKE